MRRSVNGILLLDKPIEMTSNTALQAVKRLFNAKKAGHTGSLDPLATGMLPICFGEATKFSQFLLESDKTYRVIAKLGVKTNTADAEGEEIETRPVPPLTLAFIQDALQTFVGTMDQIPPMFSAIKHHGKPLYTLARKGIEVERKPRRITIFSIQAENFNGYDEVSLLVHCSKGTYVRTLIEDISERLNTCGHVIALHRLSVSPYGQTAMYTLSALQAIAESAGDEALMRCLLPTESAVQIFPAVKLSTSAAFYLRMGQPVRTNLHFNSALVRLMSEDARFLGIGEVMADGRVKPHRLVCN